MTRFLAYNRHFLVMIVVFAMIAATLLAQAGLVGATHSGTDPLCTGETSHVDNGDGSFTVFGSPGVVNDTIDCSGSAYPVIVKSGKGDDVVDGSAFADTLLGGWGADTLNGGDGNDTLLGGWGADTLNGGDDDDWLEGGQGVDALNGGADTDTCLGGPGTDTTDGSCDPFTQ